MIDNYLKDAIRKESGLEAKAEYQLYQSYVESGRLDQDGYYYEKSTEEAIVKTEPSSDSAQLSVSANGYLNISYYLDADKTKVWNPAESILQCGNKIYADVVLDKSAPGAYYRFAGFRLSEIDENGKRFPIKTIEPSQDGLVIEITEEYAEKKLALDPIGTYEPCQLFFKSSYLDNNEQSHDLTGGWIVNDKQVTGSSTEVNPNAPCVISYEFDGSKYFFLSSEPECYYNNNEDGIVIFNRRAAGDDTESYSVQLHQYMDIGIVSMQARHVSVNNGFEQELQAGSELQITRLKYGESVQIVSDVAWKDLENCQELIHRNTQIKKQDGQTAYVYTMSVPDKDAVFTFDPAEYEFEHGTVTFMCNGDEIVTKTGLAEGRKITYKQASAEDGYWLPEGENTIVVTTAEATRKEIESIRFLEKERVAVSLKQPEYGGRIEYYADGVLQDSNVYKGDCGTEITMKFYPWEGWINNYHNGAKYVLTKAETQSVIVDGQEVSSNAFTESDNHKPKLNVVLSKSVGEEMLFGFEASGLEYGEYSYEDGWFKESHTVISDHQIGTETGVKVSIKNRAIQSGTAVKILVEMEGEDKSGNKDGANKVKYYQLITDLTDQLEPIEIYSGEARDKSGVWYETVRITVSLVDVMKLSMPKMPETGVVTIRNTAADRDRGEPVFLTDGSILEGSEDVIITIAPVAGYYVRGEKVEEDRFQTTVDFKECVENLQEMISEHPIEPYMQVTLDPQDPYGTCTYKIGDTVVSGTIAVRLEDEIKLEYTITDDAYIIDGASGILGLPIPLGKDEKHGTASIKADASFEGKTLTRESFDITVKKDED